MATYRPLLTLLREAGIAREVNGAWMFDVNAYVSDVIKRRGPLHWEDLRDYGNVAKVADFSGPGPILLYTSDPRHSQLTRMFVAAASYRLNRNNVVTNQAEVNSVVARLKPIFSQQGSILPGGDPEWNDFLEDDMNAYPMTLTYESLYVSLEEAHDPRITKDMVMMYVSPEISIQESLIPLDSTGTKVSDDIATDPRIQRIAEEKLGFITTNPDNYQKAMAEARINVAGGLPVVNPARLQHPPADRQRPSVAETLAYMGRSKRPLTTGTGIRGAARLRGPDQPRSDHGQWLPHHAANLRACLTQHVGVRRRNLPRVSQRSIQELVSSSMAFAATGFATQLKAPLTRPPSAPQVRWQRDNRLGDVAASRATTW